MLLPLSHRSAALPRCPSAACACGWPGLSILPRKAGRLPPRSDLRLTLPRQKPHASPCCGTKGAGSSPQVPRRSRCQRSPRVKRRARGQRQQPGGCQSRSPSSVLFLHPRDAPASLCGAQSARGRGRAVWCCVPVPPCQHLTLGDARLHLATCRREGHKDSAGDGWPRTRAAKGSAQPHTDRAAVAGAARGTARSKV